MRGNYFMNTRALLSAASLVAALTVSLHGHAYDPMRVLRSGPAYGSFATPYTIMPVEEREIGVMLVNFNAHYQLHRGLKYSRDDFDVLVDKANDALNDPTQVRELRDKVQEVVNRLQSEDYIVSGLISNSTVPMITWIDPLLKGRLSFDYQGNFAVSELDLPYAFGVKIKAAEIGLNHFCGDQNDDGIPDVILDPTAAFDPVRCALDTSAAIDVNAVSNFASYSFGYARQVYEYRGLYNSGAVVVGARANYFSLTTTKLELEIDEKTNYNDLYDVFNTKKGRDKSNGGFDLDLGVDWMSDRYIIGASMGNLFTPEIKYANGNKVVPGMPIAIHGVWLLHPENRRWGVRFHNDLTGQKDPIGSKQQWRALSLGYAGRSWWLPGFKLGRRWNLSKNGLSYTDVGLLLFKIIRIEAAVSDRKIALSNSEDRKAAADIPLSSSFSISAGLQF